MRSPRHLSGPVTRPPNSRGAGPLPPVCPEGAGRGGGHTVLSTRVKGAGSPALALLFNYLDSGRDQTLKSTHFIESSPAEQSFLPARCIAAAPGGGTEYTGVTCLQGSRRLVSTCPPVLPSWSPVSLPPL